MFSFLYELYSAILVPRFRYGDTLSQLRARVTLLLSIFAAAASLFILVGLAAIGSRTPFIDTTLTVTLAIMLVQLLIIGLVHVGQLRGAAILTFSFLLTLAIITITLNSVGSSNLVFVLTPLIYAGLIWTWGAAGIVLLFEVGLIIVVAVLQAQGQLLPGGLVSLARSDIPAQTAFVLSGVVTAGVLSAMFSHELHRILRYSGRQMTQLRATGEVAQLAAIASSPAELLSRTANYIRDRFGFYHVQVFLLDDERRFANLVASTGEVGEMLMQRGYRLTLGSQSVISEALQTGEPVVISSLENRPELAGRRANELLPDTRSELVLPLIVGDQVIGALDVQSARQNAFSQELIESLEVLATQVSVAAFNARQLEEYKVALNEARRMFLETEVNLREAQRLNQRLTGQAWEDYLKSRSTQIVGYTLVENRLQRDSSWSPALEQAAGSRRAVIMPGKSGRQVVAVPIELRGRSIGAIEIEMEGMIRQTEMLEVLQSLAQRLALSIDNARLFEQAQELAQRELEVNAISTSLQSVNDIDALARTTLQELSRALGAAQASIRLGAVAESAMPERRRELQANGSNQG